MRKTSQDGGDSTSITSGIENEIKKPGAIIKTKRNSIKRKVQNFSHESDDAVVEPLLQKEKDKKDKEKTDISNQSAKYNLMSKTKTDSTSERGGDKDKLLTDDKLQKSALCNTSDDTDSALSTYSMKENSMPKFTSVIGPMHNHMNTNVFSSHDALKGFVAPKSQILVEIDGSKQVGYSPSPLIFTTAKIHTDGKTKHMEPLQVTPVPILSTIEVSVLNTGKNKVESSGLVNSSISTMYTNVPKNNIKTIEKEQKPLLKTVNKTQTPSNKVVDTKIETSTDKTTVSIITPANNSTKDTKISYPTISSDNIKDNVDKHDNKRITVDSKKDQAGYETKMYTSQPTVFSTASKTNAVTPNETVKTEHATPTITNTTSIKNYTKDGAVNQEVAISKDKIDSHKYPEKQNNLDKNVKSENLDSQLSKGSDNVNSQRNVMYSSDQTSKDKTVTNSTSFNGRQLQRQCIVTDKDDHISKIKPGIDSYSSIDDSKNLPKAAEHSNSSVIEGNSEKTKLPKPNDGSVPVTCNAALSILNIVAVSKTAASITTAAAAAKISGSIITTTSVNNNKSASITTVAAPTKMSASIITTASVNKTSTSITTAASFNKVSAPITTTAIFNKSAPITTAAATNKTSIPKTTITSVNKSSVPIFTSGAINKTSASITTAASVGKTSTPITTTIINKASASITTAAVNITCAPISTSAAINRRSTPITTTVSVNKSSGPIANIASVNKSPAPVINAAATYKKSTPVITTAAASKISTPVNTTSADNKTVVPITTSAAANKSSYSSIKSSSSNTLPTSSNTPIPKQAIATTSSASEPLSTEKYSVGKATISGNAAQSKTTSSNSTTKSQVKGTVNPKPSSSTTSTKFTKASTVVTPTTTSQSSVIVKPSTVTAAKSETTKKLSTVEIQGKSTENTPKSSTSNVEPLTAKTNSTVKSSPASVSQEISNVTSAVTTSSNSVSSNKQTESKSNELSNGNKILKA